jgi:Flp pilus assembly protein TadD
MNEASLHAAVAEAAQSLGGDSQAFVERMGVLSVEHPGDAYVRLYHGIALALRPETRPDAVREIEAAVELEPDNPSYLTLAASHMFDLGELNLAREYVRAASELPAWSGSPYAADLVEVAGRIAAVDGDDDRARTLLEAALTVEPEDRSHATSFARFLIDHRDHEAAVSVTNAGLAYHPSEEALHELRRKAGWFDVGIRALSGDVEHLRCPVNDDADLVVELGELGAPIDPEHRSLIEIGGRLRCPSCGAQIDVRSNP